MFETLFAAAVSSDAADWNIVNEHRQQLRARWREFFTRFDAVLTPVSPVAAIHHDLAGDVDSRTITVKGVARPYTDQSTWPGLAGAAYLPAAVAPAGLTRDGLPVGVQVIAPYLEDRTAIDVARHLERVLCGYRQPALSRP